MNSEELHEYCINKKGVTAEFPFDENTLVYKVSGKMFALVALDEEILAVNLKCDPELAIELREQYTAVNPGYHMNKKYWNTITLDGSVSTNLIKEWIDHSYQEVVKKLSKKEKEHLL